MATPLGGDRRCAGSGHQATTGRGALPDGDPRRAGTRLAVTASAAADGTERRCRAGDAATAWDITTTTGDARCAGADCAVAG
eukprot:956771-Pyramimonas_sp.AAC.1